MVKFRNMLLTLVSLVFFSACSHVPPVTTNVAEAQIVNDQAALLNTEQRAELAILISGHNRQGPGIITLLILPELPPDTSIEDYASSKINDEKSSLNEKSNRILLVVAMKNRTLRIETGEGITGMLPDQYCKRVIDQVMVPQFTKGQYFSGIHAGMVALIERLEQ